ncbi:hypothetical protein [Anaerotruncus colihominis]|uniref:hypothetical protein n=1 Tax=Anaerotruncus colihominis TaxID=169435 RepID=UPI0019D30B53|nr:hypothetical protein [Anaerotruncus colihominis]
MAHGLPQTRLFLCQRRKFFLAFFDYLRLLLVSIYLALQGVNTGKLILQFPRRILGACEGAVKVTANGCLNLKNQRKYFLRPRRQILTPLWQKTTAPMPGAVVRLGLSLLRFYAPVFFLDHQIAFINPKI